MTKSEQPDLFAALQARDELLKQVAANAGSWMAGGLGMIAALREWSGTAEALRLHLQRMGLNPPHHHNAWGALIKKAISGGYLVPTGRYAHMATVKSHGRRTPIYRSRRA